MFGWHPCLLQLEGAAVEGGQLGEFVGSKQVVQEQVQYRKYTNALRMQIFVSVISEKFHKIAPKQPQNSILHWLKTLHFFFAIAYTKNIQYMLGFGFSQNPLVSFKALLPILGPPTSSNLGLIGFLKKGNILDFKMSNAFLALPGRPDRIKKEHFLW